MKNKQIILITDFGSGSYYQNIMKGVISGISPESSVIDLFHDIPPQNIKQAAFLLLKTFTCFPDDSIFVTVVDPGVGTNRRNLACQIAGKYFLAPDNGILSYLTDEYKVDFAISLDNSAYHLPNAGNTFHGRDIFAPAAAHLASGVNLKQLGSEIPIGSIVKAEPLQEIVRIDGSITGEVVLIDSFGNIVSSINGTTVYQHFDDNIVIGLRENRISGLSKTFADVEENEALAYIGSMGVLEIAINCGNASKIFNAKIGDLISVSH